MSVVISLLSSSDDETESETPRKRRIKPTAVEETPTKKPRIEDEALDVNLDDLMIETACETISDPDNEPTQPEKENRDLNANVPSEPEPCRTIDDFIALCTTKLENSIYAGMVPKLSIIKKLEVKCGAEHTQSNAFKKLLQSSVEKANKSEAETVLAFNDVYMFLKNVIDEVSIDVSEEHLLKLKKLGRTMHALMRKIKRLEEAECDWDLDDNSQYVQMERYTSRFTVVYNKYCKLLKKNPYSGRITHQRLNFAHSRYAELNVAINKKYKNNSSFPNYFDFEKYIRKSLVENKIELSEHMIVSEAKLCFSKIGELLISRRKQELYETQCVHIEDGDDPAKTDYMLKETLECNFVLGQKKMEDLFKSFCEREELVPQVEEDEANDENSDETDVDAI